MTIAMAILPCIDRRTIIMATFYDHMLHLSFPQLIMEMKTEMFANFFFIEMHDLPTVDDVHSL